jgi:hypothetical protein
MPTTSPPHESVPACCCSTPPTAYCSSTPWTLRTLATTGGSCPAGVWTTARTWSPPPAARSPRNPASCSRTSATSCGCANLGFATGPRPPPHRARLPRPHAQHGAAGSAPTQRGGPWAFLEQTQPYPVFAAVARGRDRGTTATSTSRSPASPRPSRSTRCVSPAAKSPQHHLHPQLRGALPPVSPSPVRSVGEFAE